jgi:hypothetical protein
MWLEPSPGEFMVRGPRYLEDKAKVKATASAMRLVAMDLFSCATAADRYHIAAHPAALAPKLAAMEAAAAAGGAAAAAALGERPFFFVMNLILPGPENLCLMVYWHVARERASPVFERMLGAFLAGGKEHRDGRFKLIPKMQNGSFIIRQSVGTRPALIGNKLVNQYHVGAVGGGGGGGGGGGSSSSASYCEIDVDISSSSVANAIVNMVKGSVKALVVDIAILLEAQAADELPEELLGCVRFDHLSLAVAKPLQAAAARRKS